MTNRRYFATGSETAFGIPSGAWDHWYRTLTDSLRDDQQHIYPDDTERADAVTSIPGPYKITGDVGGYAEPYYFGFILEHALGKWAASTAHGADVFTHSIVTTESDIEYFCAEKGLQAINRAIRYAGIKEENLRLESRMGQPLMWTATLKAFKDSLVFQIADATVETGYDSVLNPFMHHELVLQHGAQALSVQSFQLNIRNKLADAYFTSRFSNEWMFEGREVSGTVVFKNEIAGMIQRFLREGGYDSPGVTTTPYSLTATYTTAYPIAAGHYGVLKIYCPRIDLNSADFPGRGRETETVELPFKALYDRTVNYAIVATIKTTHGKPL